MIGELKSRLESGESITLPLSQTVGSREVQAATAQQPIAPLQRFAQFAFGVEPAPLPSDPESILPDVDVPVRVKDIQTMVRDMNARAKFQMGIDAQLEGNIPFKMEALREAKRRESGETKPGRKSATRGTTCATFAGGSTTRRERTEPARCTSAATRWACSPPESMR